MKGIAAMVASGRKVVVTWNVAAINNNPAIQIIGGRRSLWIDRELGDGVHCNTFNNWIHWLHKRDILTPTITRVDCTRIIFSLVFDCFWSCGDLAGDGGFNSVFERNTCGDFSG